MESNVRDAYRVLFESDAGKLVLGDLERQGFFRVTTATEEPHFMWVNEGRRQMVLYIHEMMVERIDYNSEVSEEVDE